MSGPNRFRAALAFCLLTLVAAAHAVTVKQFAPQGRVDQQTRITVQFSGEMAKLGDATAPSPFDVDCGPVSGEGRWVDAQAWSWQLARALEPGERCVLSAKPGLTALNGEALTGKNRFELFAAGPFVRFILPRPGERRRAARSGFGAERHVVRGRRGGQSHSRAHR